MVRASPAAGADDETPSLFVVTRDLSTIKILKLGKIRKMDT
jgi:hypothetical protein